MPKRQRNELKNSVFVNTSPLLSTSIPVQLRTAIYMFACYSMLLKSIYLFILFDYVSTLSKAHNSITIWALIWPTPDLIFLNVEELYWSQNLKWWKFYNVKHIMYGYSNYGCQQKQRIFVFLFFKIFCFFAKNGDQKQNQKK